MRQNTSRTLVGITCLVAAFGLAACGGSEDKASSDSSSPAVNGANIAPPDDALTGDLVGSGCTAYNKAVPTGEGSFEGMAQLPVATAASHNPMLSTLAQAVDGKLNSSVNLTDTLNSGQFTVLAPTNDAFDKMSASTFNKLKSDKVGLANLLTYHVIAGQLSPSQLPGKQSTVEGSTLNISGSGNDMKVNGVGIVCGGVKTANATVYLIDGVLTPPATK